MQVRTLHDVLIHELKDLYSAENQLIEALPKMAKMAQDEKLKAGFEKHFAETEEHVARLEEIAEELELKLTGHNCKGMKGILEEGTELLKMEPCPATDAALISSAQRVEHYEIAGYGSAVTFAEEMGHKSAIKLLKKTLAEEEKTDETLTKIATKINPAANDMQEED